MDIVWLGVGFVALLAFAWVYPNAVFKRQVESTHADLLEELGVAEDLARTAQEKLSSTREHMAELEEQRKAAVDEVYALRRELEELAEQYRHERDESIGLRERLAAAEDQLDAALAGAAPPEQGAPVEAADAADLTAFQAQLNALKARLESSEELRESLQQRLNRTEAELSASNDDARQRMNALLETISLRDQEVDMLKTALSALSSEPEDEAVEPTAAPEDRTFPPLPELTRDPVRLDELPPSFRPMEGRVSEHEDPEAEAEHVEEAYRVLETEVAEDTEASAQAAEAEEPPALAGHDIDEAENDSQFDDDDAPGAEEADDGHEDTEVPEELEAAEPAPQSYLPSDPEFIQVSEPEVDAAEGALDADDVHDDDLTEIKGIGPKLKKKLNDMGITSFEQIANFSETDMERVSAELKFPGRIEREHWVEQAREKMDA